MAAQFGRWNFDGAPMPSAFLDQVGELLTPWGPEGQFRYRDHDAELLWFPFETTEERPGQQPMVLESGEVLLWDGRLDNGPEILRALAGLEPGSRSDVDTVAAAWSEWREDCFPRLVGDWAISLWIPQDRSLLLAADLLATRHLCYVVEKDCVQWSSVPDPLILLSEDSLQFDEEYLAGWLGSFPAPHLTPFRRIRRVPPASVVTIRPGSITIQRYWDFDGTRKIRYARDAEYEEHFLDLFRQSVRRRLRSYRPIVAELSGGMDSSSIVCIADQLASASRQAKVDTVSYYNDDEPHWDERPWFMSVEAQREQTGLHIDVSAPPPCSEDDASCFRLRPGAARGRCPVVEFMMNRGHRVLLSGIGGDEFLGGVPTPVPELENLLVRGKILTLWRQTLAWALVQRRPWIDLLWDSVRGFLPRILAGLNPHRTIPWLLADFARRQHRALVGYQGRLRWTRPLPSFQENAVALEGIRRQLGTMDPFPGYPFERRYPFLDRDLLEFVFAIPREQLVRPGQRRSLMRRALRGTVPDAILDRRRKAFVSRAPVQHVERYLSTLAETERLASEEAGILDSAKYRNALHAACAGRETSLVPLMRMLALEQWLQDLGRIPSSNAGQISVPYQASSGENCGSQIAGFPSSGEATQCNL